MLYEDWLQAEGDWSKSSIVFNSMEKNKFKRRGKYVYKPYFEVEEKFGASVAKSIKKKKAGARGCQGQDC